MMVATKAKRVLIVDDVADLRMLLRTALSLRGGFDVVGEAGDGVAAIAEAERHQPDLVVLDLSMPLLDGLEALPRIREVAPDAQVVVLSGFDEARMRQPALQAGAVAYLEKGDIFAVVDALDVIK